MYETDQCLNNVNTSKALKIKLDFAQSNTASAVQTAQTLLRFF